MTERILLKKAINILVVEDNPEDREVIHRYLKQSFATSFMVLEADSGEEGLALCQSQPPDCLVLDYQLPDMDGCEFLEELKGQDRLPVSIPVIMLTGQGDETVAANSIKLGAQDYLIKDQITAESLKRSIINSIEKHSLALSLQKAEKKLLEREKIFHALLEYSNDFIVIINDDDMFSFASPSVKQFGYLPENLVDGYLGNFIHPDDLSSLSQTIDEVKKSPGNIARLTETRVCRADGSFCSVEGTLSNLSNIQNLNGIVLNGRDITARQKTEAAKLRKNLTTLKEEKRKSLEKMAGSIAHIFNNTLAGTVGYLDLARHLLPPGMPGTREVGLAETSTKEAVRLSQLMLTSLGQIPLNREEIHSDEILRSVIGALKHTTPTQISLEFVQPLSAVTCWADRENIFKILHNLIANAVEAIGDSTGHILLTTGREYCDINSFKPLAIHDELPEGYYSYITVADDGCGMDTAALANIYDPFSSSKFMGRGLGMAEVFGLTRANGGAISTYSEPAKGTVVKLYLPVAEDQSAIDEKRVVAQDDWQGSGTILLVDDESYVRDVQKVMLERLGFTVLTAEDGIEGLEIFKRKIDSICCVFLDMNLPKRSGSEIFSELKSIKSDVRVLITSGFLEEQIANEFVAMQPTGFLQKPFSFVVLKRKLQELNICQ